MDYDKQILNELQIIKEIELKQLKLLEKIKDIFVEYDKEFRQSEQYLTEVGKDGLGHPNG